MKENSIVKMWRRLGTSGEKKRKRRGRSPRRLLLERLEGRQLLTGAAVYYVNDASTFHDEWATALGNDSNDGLTPETPKASVQAILNAYDLGPGEFVRIDTGTYNLTDGIFVGGDDGGGNSAPVVFEASPYGVMFDRGGTGSEPTWHIAAPFVTLTTTTSTKYPNAPQRWLQITGGDSGIYVEAGFVDLSRLDVFGNAASGIYVGGDVTYSVTIENCVVRGNEADWGDGISVVGADGVTIRNSTITHYSALMGAGVSFSSSSTENILKNNIIATSRAYAISVEGSSSLDTSDYNLLATRGGYLAAIGPRVYGTLSGWQEGTGKDLHSLSQDPLFVDAGSGDFHLRSNGGRYDSVSGTWVMDRVNSPAIDAGDPTLAYTAELSPNGGRVNLGAYGNTEQASRSDENRPAVTAVSVSTMVGTNFDFEAEQLSPWEPLNAGPSPGPYQLVDFDVDGDGQPSQAFEILPNSGTPDGIRQEIDLLAGVTYSVELAFALANTAGWGYPDTGSTVAVVIDGTTVATWTSLNDVQPEEVQRSVLRGNYVPSRSGPHSLELVFTRPAGGELSFLPAYADDLLITHSGGHVLSDAHTNGQYLVRIDFSEAMRADGSFDPSISFDPDVSTTLSRVDGAWRVDGNSYRAVYQVSDSNVDIRNIKIGVTGVEDAAGNQQAEYAPDAIFEIDTRNPTVSVVTVAPDPRATGVEAITIQFSEPINGFELADLVLARDGSEVLLSDSQTLSSSDGGSTWLFGNLDAVTAVPGKYRLTLTAAGSDIRDEAGNVLENDILETWTRIASAAPTVSFEINDGAALTKSRAVQLEITSSSDNGEVTQMRFAINGQAEENYGVWEPFATTKTLTLPSWQGTNWINVQVRDKAGNVGFAYRSIALDTVAPTVSFSINGGVALTNSRTVNLALAATDATSGVAEMRFAINSQAEERYSGWEPFAATKTLTLPNWQGTNWVNVQVRDRAGNVRLAYASIVLDTVSPTVSFQVNGGAALTKSRTVNLAITASDATSGVADMRFAINGQSEDKFSAWEPLSATKTLTLPNWQGTNWINVQVRDRAGNVRLAYRSIVLDSVSPSVNVQINDGAAYTSSRTVNVAITASDAAGGVADMRFAINGQAEEKFSAWEPFATTKTLTLPNWQGTNWVNVQVRDRAGNVRLAYRSIILDTLSPTIVEPVRAADNPLAGISTGLSVLGADKSGEGNLVYTWTVTALPSGADAPVFSVNGTNAAKETVATFSQAGTYTFTATVTDPVNLSTTSSVTVLVSQSLSAIHVTPSSTSLAVGTKRQFSGLGLDQFGKALASQPSFAWTVSGGGTIGVNTGLFTAPATPANAAVTATSGSLKGTASVQVTLGLKDAALDVLTAAKFTNDGKLDRTDVMEILRSTVSDDNVVDAYEFGDLKTILSKAATLNVPGYVQVLAGDVVNGSPANGKYLGQALGNLAAGSPAATLNKLVDKWFLGADHPATSNAYRNFVGSLFVGDPAHTDMKQGAVSDCYLIAALGAIAKSSAAAIQNMFVDNGDNTWTVRFYAGITADYVTVDRFLPTAANGMPAYQGVGGGTYTDAGNELWLALAEKAYAQWNETGKTGRSSTENSYASLAWGSMGVVSSQLLGRTSSTYSGLPDSHKPILVAALNANKAVTYGTKSTSPDGLVTSHAYVVVGYNSTSDTFQLHNPHGGNHPGPLTYAKLRANGSHFVVADAAGATTPIAAAGAAQVWSAMAPSVSMPCSLAMSSGVSTTSPDNDATPSAAHADSIFADSVSVIGRGPMTERNQERPASAHFPARTPVEESPFSALGEHRDSGVMLSHLLFLEGLVEVADFA